MTDVRAILESEAESRRRYDRNVKAMWTVLLAITAVFVTVQLVRGKDVGDMISPLVPLVCVGGVAAGYTKRHQKALQDAIADPDPALDEHFAECLVSEMKEVATIGRRAFLERFAERLPALDSEGWQRVGQGLRNASPDESERMLRLLARGAPASAISRVEEFAQHTKSERLKTAARSALGDIRLRVAGDHIRSSLEATAQAHTDEVLRLRL